MKTLFKSKKSYKSDMVIITETNNVQYIYVQSKILNTMTMVGIITEKTKKGWRYTDLLQNDNFESSANYEKEEIIN